MIMKNYTIDLSLGEKETWEQIEKINKELHTKKPWYKRLVSWF